MWPFKKRPGPGNWLTAEQAARVVKVYYSERDIDCWFACAAMKDDEGPRLAVPTEEEAIQAAEELAEEVFLKAGIRVPVVAR